MSWSSVRKSLTLHPHFITTCKCKVNAININHIVKGKLPLPTSDDVFIKINKKTGSINNCIVSIVDLWKVQPRLHSLHQGDLLSRGINQLNLPLSLIYLQLKRWLTKMHNHFDTRLALKSKSCMGSLCLELDMRGFSATVPTSSYSTKTCFSG